MSKAIVSAARSRSCLASCAVVVLLAGGGAAFAAIVDESGAATATLAATQGSTASGTATFKSAGKDGVQLNVEVNGLKPGAPHGIHVHEKGDCSAPDATSAGPH